MTAKRRHGQRQRHVFCITLFSERKNTFTMRRKASSMRTDSPYRYLILLPDKQVGPFDRRTIIGMRIKKLLDNNAPLRRSDGLGLTVAQLMMDRFEMADAQGPSAAEGVMASGLLPTFAVDFGGNWCSAGAMGFVGKGELRFQGDVLRISGLRKGPLFSSRQDRVKLPMAAITSAKACPKTPHTLLLMLKPDQPYTEAAKGLPAIFGLEDDRALEELLDLMQPVALMAALKAK
jgi:hypothetical protein